MKIQFGIDEMTDLVMILGAAKPLFEDVAGRDDTPGIFKKLFSGYAERSEELRVAITQRANEASDPTPRHRRTKAEIEADAAAEATSNNRRRK